MVYRQVEGGQMSEPSRSSPLQISRTKDILQRDMVCPHVDMSSNDVVAPLCGREDDRQKFLFGHRIVSLSGIQLPRQI